MKKLAMLLLVGLATISCSKDDTPEAAAVTDPNTMKIYNYPSNTEIKDGDVVAINSVSNTADANALKFYFKNTSSSEMKVKIRLVSFSGVPDVNAVTFCYGPNINDGVCLQGSALTVGTSYPRNSDAQIIIPAGGTAGTGGANKFQNTATAVSPATSVNYVLEAFQVDGSGNEVGNKVRFTYRYSI